MVGLTFLDSREEVKDRAVVPDIELLAWKVSFEYVTFQPGDTTSCCVSQTLACAIDCGSRQIKDCDVGVASCNELVHQE